MSSTLPIPNAPSTNAQTNPLPTTLQDTHATHTLYQNKPVNHDSETHKEAITEHDAQLAREGRWLLEHATVLNPEEFINAHFKASTSSSNEIVPERFSETFKKLGEQEYSLDSQMYEPIKNAINNCLQPMEKGYYCFNTSKVRSPVGQGTSPQATLGPDLIITPDYPQTDSLDKLPQIVSIFTWGHISIEIKRSVGLDCGFPEGNVTELIIQEHLDYIKANMILQNLRYCVLGQFSTLPYHYVFHITIMGTKLRIWKFSPSGTQLTTAINYVENPAPFIKFLLLVKQCPVSGIGLDVGEGRMFQEIQDDLSDIHRNMQLAAETYAKESKNREWFKNLSVEPGYWIFQLTMQHENPLETPTPFTEPIVVFRNPIHRIYSIASRATRCYLGVELSFLKRQFKKATNAQRLCHMHTLKTSWQKSTRDSEVEFNSKFIHRREKNGRSQEQTQVAAALGGGRTPFTSYSRGVTKPFVIPFPNTSQNVSSILLEGIEQRLNTISEENPPEVGFPPDCIQYVISKGDGRKAASTTEADTQEIERDDLIQSSVSSIGANTASTDNASTTHIQHQTVSKHTGTERTLQWMLLKQVGGGLDGLENVKELVQVIIDATRAHEDLYKENILHRDVSINNVMIDLTSRSSKPGTRRGLLIDLDMAKDLEGGSKNEQKTNREITGTLFYMAVRLAERPKHHIWHEIESMSWVTVSSTVRHVPNVEYHINGRNILENRSEILSKIFRDPGTITPMGDVVEGKVQYLHPKSRLEVPTCLPLDEALKVIKANLSTLYQFVEDLVSLQDEIDRFENRLFPMQKAFNNTDQFYHANSCEDLTNAIVRTANQLEALEGAVSDSFSRTNLEVFKDRIGTSQKRIKTCTINFPSHQSFIKELTKVLHSEEAFSCSTQPYERQFLGSAPSRAMVSRTVASSKRPIEVSEQQDGEVPQDKKKTCNSKGKRKIKAPEIRSRKKFKVDSH